MAIYVKKFDALGIYGRFDIHQEFKEGVNIIFGKNGAGKTTLLHILANALSGDFDRFKYLKFHTINITLSNSQKIHIVSKEKDSGNIINIKMDGKAIYPTSNQLELSDLSLFENDISNYIKNKFGSNQDVPDNIRRILMEEYLSKKGRTKELEPIISIAYFPAFRTMIEAWMAAETKNENEPRHRYSVANSGEWKDFATLRARSWFGNFTPMVNFPSLIDIEDQLGNEIEKARMTVWRTDQRLLSDAFLQIFKALSTDTKGDEKLSVLLEEIQGLFDQLDKSPLRSESRIEFEKLRELISKMDISGNTENTALRVLMVYRNILESTLNTQNGSFEGIQKYLSSVNEFFDGKSLIFKQDIYPTASRKQSIVIKFDNGSFSTGLRTLSSGERQIMTLVYAATHMSQQQIVLIDEPEISLHVDWQRMLIRRMAEQLGDRQIIACTHSPVIGSDHLDDMRELSLVSTKIKSEQSDKDIEEIPV